MLDDARGKGDLLVLDGGRSLSPKGMPRDDNEREQRRLKAELVARSFVAGGIDAMTVAGADWTLGREWLVELAARERLPVLAANLVCDGTAPFPGGKVFEQAGLKIGVVAVTEGPIEGCEVGEPRAALRAAVEALGPVDVRIGLVPVDTDRGMAALAAPEVGDPLPLDLVIDGRGRFPETGADRRGATWWIPGGQMGKKLGFLELTRVPGATSWRVEGGSAAQTRADLLRSRLDSIDRRLEQAVDAEARARLQRQRDTYAAQIAEVEAEAAAVDEAPAHRVVVQAVDLDTTIADHPETLRLVTETKQAITRVAGADPRSFVPRLVTDASSPFAGGESCVRCHDQEHAQWSTTGHARAWNGLVNVERALDEQCWTCHVTGARAAGGPDAPTATAGFRDVQCEACHGPSRPHADAPKEAAVPVAKPGVEACTGCHDGEQDQGRFDAGTYLPKVVHEPAAAQAPR